MIETLMMDIESIYRDRQVITRRVTRRKRVHYPFIPRISDVYRRRFGDEMDGELGLRANTVTSGGGIFEGDILIIIHYSPLDLHGLDDRYSRFGKEGERGGRSQRFAINHQHSAVGVGSRVHRQREVLSPGHASVCIHIIVNERDFEDGRLVCRYIADGVLVECNLRILDRQCCISDDELTGEVPLCALFTFVRTMARTGFAEEDEGAVFLLNLRIGNNVYIQRLLQLFKEGGVHWRPIDANGGIGIAVRCDGEAYLTRDSLTRRGGRAVARDIKVRLIVYLPRDSRCLSFYFQGLFSFIHIIAVGVFILLCEQIFDCFEIWRIFSG